MTTTSPGDAPLAGSIRGVLDALCGADDGVEGCALLTLDGAVIASVWPHDAGAEALGATAAALFGAGGEVVRGLARGSLEWVMLHASGGWVLLGGVGDGTTLLAVQARADARLGVVRVAVRRGADRLATLLLPPFPAFS